MSTRIKVSVKRTQRDYSLSFKLSVIGAFRGVPPEQEMNNKELTEEVRRLVSCFFGKRERLLSLAATWSEGSNR